MHGQQMLVGIDEDSLQDDTELVFADAMADCDSFGTLPVRTVKY